MTDEIEELPSWAPRVTQHKIRQLYEDDAKGIRDEDLIEDVGYSLLCRCESFIAAPIDTSLRPSNAADA